MKDANDKLNRLNDALTEVLSLSAQLQVETEDKVTSVVASIVNGMAAIGVHQVRNLIYRGTR